MEFSRPASPQDNGSHERMHRDLKAEATKPPSVNLPAQQRRFERWRHEFNHERPHKSLGMRTPASFYQPSGHLWHDGHHYFVGEVYAGKHVALHHNFEGAAELHFANLYLGNLIYNPQVARFRPPAYIERPPIPSTTPPTTSLDYQIYLDKVSPMSPDCL